MPVMEQSWRQGTLVGDGLVPDRFRVRQPLGRGAHGRVYLAWDRLHERDVALKRLELAALDAHGPGTAREAGGLPRSAGRARGILTAREACLHEARALARVRHPNVVTVYELVRQVDPPYLVMEYVEGEELEQRLRQGAPLSPEVALAVARAVAAALVAAHAAGVLHRDVKPSNVMVGEDGDVKLIDFGVALRHQTEEERAPHAGEGLVGTPFYLAPEVLAGGAADELADIYAVGVLLYRMLALTYPFEAETLEQLRGQIGETAPDIRQHRPEVPVPLAEVVAGCLAPRERRLASAAALLRELERAGQAGARPLPQDPYLGLSPFTAQERGVFFGREDEVARVLGRLRVCSTVVLVGVSGAGKSSLAMAGVAPAVAAGALDESRRWSVQRMTPGCQPLLELARCVARAGGSETDVVERELRASPQRWWRLVDPAVPRGRRESGRPGGLLLVVDQLEELVTVCADPDERRGLGQALRGALAADICVRVVVTLRDDFLARLGDVEGLSEALEAIHIVRPLDGEGLRAAVVEPARAFGFSFEEEAMVERIVQDLAGRSGTMPLLGFAMQRLWEQRDQQARVIPRAALDRMEGIGAALARAADEAVEGLGHQGLLAETRRVMLELLTPQGTKRTRGLDDLLAMVEAPPARARVQRAVEQLRAARLVVGSDRALELAHEALVTEWSLLRRWIDESRALRELAADARHAASRWVARGRPRDLLWRGEQVQEARRLPIGSLAPEATAFVEDSLRHARRQRWIRVVIVAAGLAALAVAGTIYVRRLAVERDLARRQAAAERRALTAQSERADAERGRTRAVEERRKLLEAWVAERQQLLADLSRTEQSGLRQHIMRRLTREGPPGVRLKPPTAGRVEVCLFGPAKDLSMAGDWPRKTSPAARLLRSGGYVVGCEYPYVRGAFRAAARSGLLQHDGQLPDNTLSTLVSLLRSRYPEIEVRRIPSGRLFRAVDILLPD